ncbi:T9SS type A sorting domain-containing protein [Ferruginibacter lapsinanis]|uniref:T9SS type A sorting domain-containing protein n=1 Tax=Ferruginibacter lapsinanis TaxID=563172 RepID=UPI001E44122B|nr:T9SS type A sorting domain-containing protein [Ferruginibacter lapsinanis]UEG48575.1 T9SS type A sorting domain-containing protein [Ferruginibacter lapsinanis]
MKKIFTLIFLFGTISSQTTYSQSAFTPGNLVITRVGIGDKALSSAATPVFLQEITTAGAAVQTITVPFHATQLTGTNNKFTTAGSSSNDANLTVSGNGAYFVLTGYSADTGTATISSAANVKRVIARVSMDGTVNTSTLLDVAHSSGNSRCAATNDGTGFWHVGSTGGLRYVPFGCTGISPDTAVVVSTSVTNFRSVQVVGSDIITGAGSGTVARIGSLSGFPTTNGNTITNLPGMRLTVTANSIYMTHLPGGPDGLNTLYFGDDVNPTGIKKFSLNMAGTSWDSTGIMDAGGAYRGLTGTTSGSTVTLYGIRGGSPLNAFVDASGYGVAPTATPTLVLAAATNTAFRGVQIVPPSSVNPVRLNGFTTQKSNSSVSISWGTEQEFNTHSFVIQRSADGINWTDISSTPAAGNSSTLRNYSVVDNSPISGFNYYRLKEVAIDGSVTLSETRKVLFSSKYKVLISPNPAKDFIKVYISKENNNSNTLVKVIDFNGKLVRSESTALSTIDISTYGLSKGIYFVKVTDATHTTTQKIAVQ